MAEVLHDGLCVRELACARGGRRVFAGVSFDAAPGDVIQIRGSNGSGKSSLLRLLCGLLQPTGGHVHWRSRRVGTRDAAFASEVAYMGHAGGMSGELTVFENLRFSLHVAGATSSDAACRDVLRKLRLADRENERMRHLSQGQQRRLSLARVLLSQRPLWLLDEPCAGLDAEGEESFDACLAEHVRSGGMAVVTTHRDIDRDGPCAQTLDMNRLSDGIRPTDHRP
ncbi:cytochrome c biogenesis heme-transporting ATPase CcmA [Variovorax sp. J2P1-59]|uniref:cytochrome c biogenesis heme-transporting ATPase CcmA n=1 Tax=Variovorax flavidus TaxID=3053501 RepID=UPI0025752F70|nr:cytochrome c biogenesis heme-transporting ATPase CcmA [Variovorax sp. J2P1-59]MDM0076205.1 cytochrome c biogenesis heme-transporting ATPase CcmA [Variovorax sp. J2P1-59]